ncbi:MAG: Ig-like domain-containing protein [Anaerolineae bacterium]
MSRRVRRASLLLLALLLLLGLAHCLPPAVRADLFPMRLTLQRISGADVMGHVAGTFRLAVIAPDDVQRVTFYLDGDPIAEATSHPFAFQFNTAQFAPGEHRLQAVAWRTDGSVAMSNSLDLAFRTNNWQKAVRQSLFLYAAVVVVLGICAFLAIRHLLHLQPRLQLLNR